MDAVLDALSALPPWEAAAYFQTITERRVDATGSGIVQCCAGDPNRVGLILSNPSASALSVTTRPNGTSVDGILLGGSSPPLILLFSRVGPLCQMAWFHTGGIGLSVSVWEISLTRWPNASAPNRRSRRANSTQRAQRNSDRR